MNIQRRGRRSFRQARNIHHYLPGLAAIALLCLCLSTVRGQEPAVVIRIFPTANRVVIEGNRASTRVWSFRDSYAGILELGSRIERLRLFDNSGALVPNREIAPGQFASETPAARFQYEVRLTPPGAPADAAKISWLNQEHGVLMLGDLLPLTEAAPASRRIVVQFVLPADWAVYSNNPPAGTSNFEVTEPEDAVFVVGNHLRATHTTVSGMSFNLFADGEWAFTDSEAADLAGKVLKAHRDVLGAMPAKQATLILLPFPNLFADRWSAETRGATVTLLLGKIPSKIAALVRLSTPLTHEFFHLWVPNALELKGDYDWFSEGFTVYQAARAAVRLQMLTFPEFLDAIAAAYDGYVSGADHDRWSLIEASQRRWTVGEASVYAKSMVVAFLFDLKLRSQTRGRRSLDDAYHKLCQHYCSKASSSLSAGQADGNNALMNVLGSESAAQDFVRLFIYNPVSINLQMELEPFGLRVERFGSRTRITVSEQLTRQQRDLLRELGYNDASRFQRRGI
jgi:predicted metalloprotease with PDZ domain